MGYTHYWRQSRPFTAQEWSAICAEAKRIIDAASNTIDLRGPMGTGSPDIGEVDIAFNGCEAKEEDHESFVLERDPKDDFAFCKTARKPYDPVVVSILYAAQKIAPDAIKVSSDGGRDAIKLVF